MGLRTRLPTNARGSYEAAAADGAALTFQRRHGGEHALVLINYGTVPRAWPLRALPAGARLQPAWPPAASTAERAGPVGRERVERVDARGAVTLTIPAQSVLVYTVHADR
jgi:hypothetical protein